MSCFSAVLLLDHLPDEKIAQKECSCKSRQRIPLGEMCAPVEEERGAVLYWLQKEEQRNSMHHHGQTHLLKAMSWLLLSGTAELLKEALP